MVVGLSVNLSQSFSQILLPPDEFFEIYIFTQIITFMLEKILVLLNQLLWPKPTIFIEQIDFQYLLFILSICWTEKSSNNEWEVVSECSESYICCENVVIVWVEKLYSFQFITRSEPIPNAYWKYRCLSITGNGIKSSHYAELLSKRYDQMSPRKRLLLALMEQDFLRLEVNPSFFSHFEVFEF